ncbi:ribonuclease 3-like protein 2 [Zingiber officinale]|uniref:Uncharacterized protein n=1 Tax=Zingiber officinale TaxID=94328 RepID=A0A8J5K9D7_ZINOF|nr:ribonuclease 3-like protein 2 [Zingiber officinale]KAG6479140.1 hypothetical protein ZIOFF_062601 [Zingiber officinale]
MENDGAAAAAAAAAVAGEEHCGPLSSVAEIEGLLGYTFRDPSLLTEALTHGSHPDRPSYQRLEFVGDAVLGLAFTKFLYFSDPSLGSGKLTVLRSANLSTEKLARVAVRHQLYRYLRRHSAALDQLVVEFTDSVMAEREEEIGELSYGGSNNKARKVLADMVESIAAAVYIDCNFDLELVWKVFRVIMEPIITMENMNEHPVTILYEFYQKQKQGKRPEFEYSTDGLLHTANAVVDGVVIGTGVSPQKRIAKLNAARDALQKMSEMEADLSSI